jgi:nitrogen fixation/metabolism regulation signal transduction histidine kinase
MATEQTGSRRQRRRQTVVLRELQIRVAVMALVGQLIVILAYQSALQLRIGERISSASSAETEAALRSAFADSFITLLIIGPVVGVLMFLLALWVSNRLVGPLPRLREAMRKIGQGDYSARLGFRPEDLLLSVSEDFNLMADALQRRHGAAKPISRLEQEGEAAEMAKQIVENVLRGAEDSGDRTHPPSSDRH